MKLSKVTCLGALLMLPFMGLAQDAGIDLWDSWRQGFETYESAEKNFKSQNLDEALKLYRESQKIFLKIRKASPEWNKEVVTYRLSLCLRKINAIEKPRKEAAEAARRKSDMEKLKAEVDTLTKQLRQTRVELIDAKSAAERNALTEKQVKQLLEENTELSKKIAARDASISSMKTQLEKADRSADYKKQLLKVSTDLEKSNQLNQRLRKNVEEQQARVKKYYEQRLEVENKNLQLADQVRDLEAQKKKVEALSVENRKLADSVSSSLQDLKNKEEKLAELQQKNIALADRIESLESGKITLPSARKLQQELADEKRKTEHLNTISEKQKLDLKALNTELEKKSAEHNKVVMELVKSTEALTKLRTDHSDLIKNHEEQNKVVETAKVLAIENALLKKNIEDIAKKYEDLNKNQKTGSSAVIANLQKELDSARLQTVQLQKTIDSMKSDSKTVKIPAAVPEAEFKKLQTERDFFKRSAAASAAEAEKIKGNLDQLTRDYEAVRAANDKLKQHEIVLLRNISEKSAKNVSDDGKLQLVTSRLEEITKERNQLLNQIAVLEKFRQESEKLRQESEKVQQNYANLQKDFESFKVQSAKSADNTELKKELESLKVINRNLEKSLVVAKNDAKATISSYEASSSTMKNSLELLKKQLIVSQETEQKIKKDLALLKMEYADLEKKISASVSADDFRAAEAEKEKLRKDLSALRMAKSETDAALKSAEELNNIQKKRLEAYAKEIDPTAKDQIVKLTAAIAELQEGKMHYENAIRDLKGNQEILAEDNKALKLANTVLQSQIADLKVKPEEYLRKSNDLLQKNMNLEETLQETKKKLDAVSLSYQLDQSEIARLNKELHTVKTLADRYRKELTEWDDIPQTDAQIDLQKKNEAINELVKETAELRKERDMLNTELTISKDHVVKYKQISKNIENNLRITRDTLSKLKAVLARYTSGEEVEKLIAQEFKKDQVEVVASVPLKKEEPQPELTPEEKEKNEADAAEKKKQFQLALEEGLAAESEERYSDALLAYFRANDFNPESPEAKMGLARVYYQRKDLKNSVGNYKSAVEDLGMSRNMEFEEKLKELTRQIDVENAMKSAVLYLENQVPEKSEKFYKKALRSGMKRNAEFEKQLEALKGDKLDLEDVPENEEKKEE